MLRIAGSRCAASGARAAPAAAPGDTRAAEPLASLLADRHGDEVRVVCGLDPHQHVVLAARFGFDQRTAQFIRRTDALAADVEDDVTGLQTVLRRWTVGIDVGDHNALVAGAGDKGLVIVNVDPNGKGAELGFQQGDVILKAGSKDLTDAADLTAAMSEAKAAGRKSTLVMVSRDHSDRYVAVPVLG